MALWAKVQEYSKVHGDMMRQLQSVYGVHFPVDVRHTFADWIEEQPWFDLDEDNPEHERQAASLLEQLVHKIENRANELNSEDMFIIKLRLQEIGQGFKATYGPNPFNLVRVVRTCLGTEQQQVQQAEGAGGGDSEHASIQRQIYQQFDLLQRKTQLTDAELRQLEQKQQGFAIRFEESQRLEVVQQTTVNNIMEQEQLHRQKQAINLEIQTLAKELLQMHLVLAQKYGETCRQLEQLQNCILDQQLISWKRQQQLAGNGAPVEGSLVTLQKWCESLAELIWQNRTQIKHIEKLRLQTQISTNAGHENLLSQLNAKITGLLSSLVTSTFIIEKQPPQVLKKDSKFGATVRLMVGGKLNVNMNPPPVMASIISEEQARSLLRSERDVRREKSGEILNNNGTMEYNQTNGTLSVAFRNMILKKIKRAEKKGNETVTEEKFSILFQSHFTVGNGELDFQVWTLSLPVVVTVHGNQECNAMATILWDNAFAESGRTPFQVPERVLWPQLAQALNTKFEFHCGVGLDAQHLAYLASKIFNTNEDFTSHMVTWAQFNRDPLHGRNFTFWEYFYSVVKLTKDWLHGPWKDKLIRGFLSKQDAQDILLKRPVGTFLLRFSDSELGGITIAWTETNENKLGEKQVWNLEPFTDKHFKVRALGDRVKDLHQLVTLFPDTPKHECFAKFWTEPPARSLNSGYIAQDLVQIIPKQMEMVSAPFNYDNPQTPSTAQQPQSPVTGGSAGGSNLDSLYGQDAWVLGDLDYNPSNIDDIDMSAINPQNFTTSAFPTQN